jgi:hypothetical protein
LIPSRKIRENKDVNRNKNRRIEIEERKDQTEERK